MGVNAFLDKRSCDLQNYEQIYHNTTISGVCGFGLQDIGDFVVVLCDNINLDLSFAYLIFKNNIKVVVLFFFSSTVNGKKSSCHFTLQNNIYSI